MMKKWLLVVGALGVLMVAQSASATPVVGNLGSLQTVLDNITVSGPSFPSSSVTVATDAMSSPADDYWGITGGGSSGSTMIIELASFQNSNTFGVYDRANPSVFVPLFAGTDAAGDQVTLSIKLDGSVYVNNVDTTVDFAGNAFGFYLDATIGNRDWNNIGPNDTAVFYSDETLNADGQYDHLAVYQGKDVDDIQLPNIAAGTWTDNEFILAWEDLWNGGDEDYTDMVLMIESVEPVPEASAIALWCVVGGVFGIGCWFRRRRQIPE